MSYFTAYISIGIVIYLWVLYIGIRDKENWIRLDDGAELSAHIVMIFLMIYFYPILLFIGFLLDQAEKDRDR